MLRTVVIALCAATAAPAFAAEAYEIDSAHAHVGLAVRHFGVADMHCGFGEVTGTIAYDSADITQSKVAITIETASLYSDNAARASAIQGEMFLDAVNHPQIRFVSSAISKDPSGLTAHGQFTARGVSRTISFPFTLNGPRKDPFGGQRLGIEATFTLKRSDYGLPFQRALADGTPWVGDEVRVTLSVEATPKRAPEPAAAPEAPIKPKK